jgi:hypothetical protein
VTTSQINFPQSLFMYHVLDGPNGDALTPFTGWQTFNLSTQIPLWIARFTNQRSVISGPLITQ